ncbi:MAG: hypothetical protein KJI71_04620 [Patescibacteria group bacterium]|nr:hypothetical protein [Patescibacteria group bacterium]
MSSDNGIWLMFFEGKYHVWYSSCPDNDPERPNYAEEWYRRFDKKDDAIKYANDLIKKCEELDLLLEYGIMEVGVFQKPKQWDSLESFRKDAQKFSDWVRKNKIDVTKSFEMPENLF